MTWMDRLYARYKEWCVEEMMSAGGPGECWFCGEAHFSTECATDLTDNTLFGSLRSLRTKFHALDTEDVDKGV